MAAHQLLLLCVVMVADISMSVAEPVPSMGSSTRMEVFWSSFSPGLAPAPAPAPVPAPAPARGWADSGGAESEQIRRLGRHQGDRSTAGGDVILGAFATAMFASVFATFASPGIEPLKPKVLIECQTSSYISYECQGIRA